MPTLSEFAAWPTVSLRGELSCPAKQYIAYYNWTFGVACGYAGWGSAPPNMADLYGNLVPSP